MFSSFHALAEVCKQQRTNAEYFVLIKQGIKNSKDGYKYLHFEYWLLASSNAMLQS